MAKRYGINYQGSKNSTAEWVVGILPPAAHLYDVFCGGGAVTQCALESGKWGCVHFSDKSDVAECVRDIIEGNLPDMSEWVSRAAFFARKDTEPWVRVLWSFGGDCRTYLYSRELEPYKKAVHEMLFAPTPEERRLLFKEVCRLIPFAAGLQSNYPPQFNTRKISELEHLERRASLSRESVGCRPLSGCRRYGPVPFAEGGMR